MESMADVKPKVSAILEGAPLFAALTEAEIAVLICPGSRAILLGRRIAVFRRRPVLRSLPDRFWPGPHLQGFAERAGTGAWPSKVRAHSIAELPVFDGGSYPASAISIGTDRLVICFAQRFPIGLPGASRRLRLKVLQVVGGRLRRLVGIIEELSFTTVRHRLISWLLRQAKTQGDRRPVVLLSASQQELASQIGTVRELVSRNLARLQAQGFISISGREVTILDEAGLEADLSSTV